MESDAVRGSGVCGYQPLLLLKNTVNNLKFVREKPLTSSLGVSRLDAMRLTYIQCTSCRATRKPLEADATNNQRETGMNN
jgi:hypothetical protein